MKNTDTFAVLAGCAVLLTASCGLTLSMLAPVAAYEVEGNRASRVASVDYRSDEILLALLPPERIVALSPDADNPDISNITAEAKHVPARTDLNVERLIALQPDLVIAAQASTDDPSVLLSSCGIRILRQNSATTLDEIRSNILEAGRAVGEGQRARVIVAEMNRRISFLRSRTKGHTQSRTLYVYFGGAGTDTAGKGTYIDELMEVAGAFNAARETGASGWYSISVEEILALNPAVIFSPDARGRSASRNLFPPSDFAGQRAWRDVKAVREGRVYRIPGRILFSASHHCVNAAEVLARLLNPDLFSPSTQDDR